MEITPDKWQRAKIIVYCVWATSTNVVHESGVLNAPVQCAPDVPVLGGPDLLAWPFCQCAVPNSEWTVHRSDRGSYWHDGAECPSLDHEPGDRVSACGAQQ